MLTTTEDKNLIGSSLNGIDVLLDGYNIQLTQGTGIKSYSLNLASTLSHLDANVSILTSRPLPYTKYPILEAVFFAEAQRYPSSKRALYLFMLKQGLKLGKRLKHISKKDYPIFPPSEFWVSDYTVYNYPYCFDLANNIYKQFPYVSTFSLKTQPRIFHATYPLPIKIKGSKKITTIHDLIPLRLPYTTLDNKKFFFENVRQSIENSDLIFAVSESTRTDILNTFEVEPDKVVVTYQSLPLQPLTDEEAQILKQGSYHQFLGLEYKKYILFVGAIEPKKNVGRLIEAYASLNTDMPLVIVGKKAWLWEDQLEKLGRLSEQKRSKVILLDYVSKTDLRYLFAGAYCFVFPSLYEGFGIPVLEAMSFGCPVITSYVSSLPEVAGEAALYVDPYNVTNIAMMMEKLINSSSLCRSMVEKGHKQVNKFSQSSYQEKILQGYLSIL